MSRVAVQVGAAWLRVAVDGPPPRLLAELPACSGEPGAVLAGLLHGLVPGPPDELLVLQPVGEPAPPLLGGFAGLAPTVRAVPAAVAAAAGADAGRDGLVVLDVGHAGAEAALVRGGQVVAARRVPVGGARLDGVTRGLLPVGGGPAPAATVRAAREALSLRPEVSWAGAGERRTLAAEDLRAALAGPLSAVVEAVREVLGVARAGRAPPVLLVGGVARTPLLAEMLDAAGIGGVRVAPRPDAVAVLGALRLPVATPPCRPTPPPAAVGAAPPPRSAATPWSTPTGPWLPPVAPPGHRWARVLLGVALAVGVAVGLLAVRAAPEPVASAAAGDLVQYGYAVRLPAGWAHTGGLPERRRSLLTPVATPDGSDLISVERTPLGYDADAEPARARAELRAAFDAAVRAGAPLSGYSADARVAGRPVVAYREAGPGRDVGRDVGRDGGSDGEWDVDWYVVLDGDAQLSVGCRHTAARAAVVRAACATVVGSLRRTS